MLCGYLKEMRMVRCGGVERSEARLLSVMLEKKSIITLFALENHEGSLSRQVTAEGS